MSRAVRTRPEKIGFAAPPRHDETQAVVAASPECEDWLARLLAGDPVVKRVWNIVSASDPVKLDAWLRYGRAIADGMDAGLAKIGFDEEIAAIDAVTWNDCPGSVLRSAIGGYAAWVAEHGDRARYGVTMHGTDTVMGEVDTVRRAKRDVISAVLGSLRPIGQDGRQAIRLSGVAHLLGDAGGHAAPDAQIVGWCDRYVASYAEYEAITGPFARQVDATWPPEVDAQVRTLWSEQEALLQHVNGVPAMADAGRFAKARLALTLRRMFGAENEDAAVVTDGLLQDIVARDHEFLAGYRAAMERLRLRDEEVAAHKEAQEREAEERRARRAEPLEPGTPEWVAHQAASIRVYRAAVRHMLRLLREAQAKHGLPLPPDDGAGVGLALQQVAA